MLKCRWLHNGGLIIVTVLILAGFTYFFVFDFIRQKGGEVLFTDSKKAYTLHFIGICYLSCMLLAFIALFMTYWTGPGYSSDHFKAVKYYSAERDHHNNEQLDFDGVGSTTNVG